MSPKLIFFKKLIYKFENIVKKDALEFPFF